MNTTENTFQVPVSLSLSRLKDIAWESSGKVTVDGSGKIVNANPRAEAIFGAISGGLNGLEIEALIHPASRDNHRSYRTDFIANPMTRFMNRGRDVRGVRLDTGVEVSLIVSLKPFKEEGHTYVMATVDEVPLTERLTGIIPLVNP